jgi:hypothetical protein
MPHTLKLFLAALLIAGTTTAQKSIGAPQLTTRCEPPPGSLARLTRSQKEAFLKSQDIFIAGRFGDALGALRNLLAQVPSNTPAHNALAERTAEAALESGERAFAISLLKPVEERDGNDCSARTLLARAYAEEGRFAERDVEISAITALHEARKSPAGKLDVFLLEQHRLEHGGIVSIWYALRPWGPHNTHLYSEILDGSGNMKLRIELDSDDPDQVYFREVHPDLAAKGDRRFSLDAFATDRTGNVEHALIQFYDGRPSYDAVRERILKIAEHSGKPIE